MKWLADENFPLPSFHILQSKGFDIKHIGIDNPSVEDQNVIAVAIDQNRIILTFDSDFGELVFRYGFLPPGVIYFRLTGFTPTHPAFVLTKLPETEYSFDGFFTIVGNDSIRQRLILAK
jgi:predicted nuclease of predicted toxin-antitoxin system